MEDAPYTSSRCAGQGTRSSAFPPTSGVAILQLTVSTSFARNSLERLSNTPPLHDTSTFRFDSGKVVPLTLERIAVETLGRISKCTLARKRPQIDNYRPWKLRNFHHSSCGNPTKYPTLLLSDKGKPKINDLSCRNRASLCRFIHLFEADSSAYGETVGPKCSSSHSPLFFTSF